MFTRQAFLIPTLLWIAATLVLSSCTLPGATPPPPIDADAILTVAAQTIQAQVAEGLTQAAPLSPTDTPPGPEVAEPEVAPTETSLPTATPTATTPPPPPTETPQPEVAQPTATATPTPTAGLSPTPARTLIAAGFRITAVNLTHCNGVATAIFHVLNTGNEAFESARVQLDDVTAGRILGGPTSSDTPFRQSDRDCQPGGARLAAGGTGYVGSAFNTALPSGRLVRGTIMLCTQDGLSGRCSQATVDFTVP